MQNQQPAITLDPPWWRCENGCEFRCGQNKPAECPVCRSVEIEMIPEVNLDMSDTRIYGYFTDRQQTAPIFDPGLTASCPICGKALDAVNVRTISLMVPGDVRSYFYRVHRSCHEPLTEQERVRVDGLLIDAIYSAGNTN